MSRIIDINITDNGTSVKVVNNGKTVIEATIAEPRQLLLNEAAGKITVLKNNNDQVLNDFDIIYSQVSDKLGTTTVKEYYDKLIELRAFKKGGGWGEHIKDYPDNFADLKDRNFYYKNVYESSFTPRGLYATAFDLLNPKRIILDLGVGDYRSQGSNFFPVYWDTLDTYVIHVSPSYGDIVITFPKKVQGKTLVLMLNPLDKNVTIEDIPADKLTALQPNVWNLIYIHFVGQMNKANLGLGTTGTVNIYDVTIKQPIIS